MAEEHINAEESHYSDACPGPAECVCSAGLRRILDDLNSGRLVIRQVDPPD